MLMAIIMPALQKAKEGAREVKCRSNLRNVGVGLTMYLQENDFKPFNNDTTNGFYWYDHCRQDASHHRRRGLLGRGVHRRTSKTRRFSGVRAFGAWPKA